MTHERARNIVKYVARLTIAVRILVSKQQNWRHVHKVADKFEPVFMKVISAAFAAGKNTISRSRLRKAVEIENEQSIFSIMDAAIIAFEKGLQEKLEKVLAQTRDASAAAAEKILKTRRNAMRAAAPKVKGFKFDATNPAAVKWAQEHAAELIEGLNKATREAIKDAVEDAFTEQFDVAELADRIADLLGNDARAETIARTEVMRASNEGQQELWDQAVEAGVLTGDEKQEWIVTPDDRLCPVCEPMDGVTVGLNEKFDVDGDEIDGPPAHPNCRCTVGLSV